jgi:hypothetical protein
MSWIFEKANVLEVTYGNYATIKLECNIALRDKIISKTNQLNGELLV